MLCMHISYYLLLEKGAIDNNKKERKKEIERKKTKTAFLIYAQNIVVWVCWFFFSYLVRAFDSHAEGLCSNPGHNGQSCLKRYM